MTDHLFMGLMHNAALLLALAYAYSLLVRRWSRSMTVLRQLLFGLIVTLITVAIMLTRWELEPGIVFDTRSVLLGISGLYLGPIPTGIAMLVTGLMRWTQGGTGAATGVAVILFSGGIGLIWRQYRRDTLSDLSWGELLAFGLLIHLVMIGLFFLMPLSDALRVLRHITLPVLIIYPLATVFVGMMMSHGLKAVEAEQRLAEQERQLRSMLDEAKRSRQELANAMEELKHSAESLRKLSAVAEQSPASIIITDLDGNIEYVNPTFTDITGYTPEEVIGKNPRLVQSGETPLQVYEELWNTITQGGVWQGELRNRKKDGTLFWERAIISPIFAEDGSILRYLGIKEDITQQKTLEDQFRHAQKMEAIGRLAGGVAHDFNNKLQTILGSAELALHGDELPATLQEEIRAIKQAAEQSADLTRQLLAFARRQTYQPRIINLNESISDMTKVLQRMIGSNIAVRWKPGANLWHVKLDPSQLDQILANLAVNSRDAMPETGTFTVATQNMHLSPDYAEQFQYIPAGDYVLVTVSDTGCGMTKEVKERIFDPFYTTKKHGTGLGLSTVYGIVNQNGGFVHIYSEVDVGTTVKLYFPRADADSESRPEIVGAAPENRGDETLLLVDDEPAILKLTADFLTKAGYRVLSASGAEDALAKSRDYPERIHLLISDVFMPGTQGHTLSERIREERPDIKVLYISGYTYDAISERGMLEPHIDFLQKPFSMSSITQKVREILNR